MIFSLAGNEEFIKRLTELILENLEDENFGVKELVSKTGMKPSAIHRRLKSFANKTLSQFICEIRLRKSLELLQQDEVTVSEVAYRVGFSSPAYFNKCFHDYFGYPPGEFKKRGLNLEGNKQDILSDGSVAERKESKVAKIKRPGRRVLILTSLGILAIIILTFLINNFLPGILAKNSGNESKNQEKSIALLPFRLLSNDPDNQYLADGMMDAILVHLSKIEDLRVLSRTSVEQYKGTIKTIPRIGMELGVEYLLESSFQKKRDSVRLIVQLIKAREDSHAWAKEYDINWSDIFSVQSEVAQTVAHELHAIITPEEKKLIEKVPTTDLKAYDLYMKANKYQRDYAITRDLNVYNKAVTFYEAATSIDSAFAKAYVGLGTLYRNRYFNETYFKKNFLDSCLIMADKAILYDDQLDEAYYLKGRYYRENGNIKEALENFDTALLFNPNNYGVYQAKGWILIGQLYDFVKGIDNFHKALNLIQGDERSTVLTDLANAYAGMGFPDKAKYYYREAFKLHGNEAFYQGNLAWIEFCMGNIEKALKVQKKAEKVDSTGNKIEGILYYTMIPGHSDEKAYLNAKKLIEYYKKLGTLNFGSLHRYGYVFWRVGKQKEAENFFDRQIKNDEERIEFKRPDNATYYRLAASYAFLGNKEKAYYYLEEFDNKCGAIPRVWFTYAKFDPLLDGIRNEERFQKILHNIENKYQVEHERVKKWLQGNNML